MTTPDVFSYLDHREFLSDWFDAKKRENPRFSHRMFARMAGQKSSGLLLHVIRGERNLTEATTDAFSKAMRLRADERDHFRKLVDLDKARTPQERNQVFKAISASRRFREARQVEGEGFEYLSHWYHPAIRELAHRSDFRPDPDWVARQLRPRITVAQARSALELLKRNDMLVERGDRWVPAEATVVTPHEVAGLAVHNYHQGMLRRASEAIEAFEPEERHFGAVTVTVPVAMVQKLKDEVSAFQERLLDLCDGMDAAGEVVMQVNLQLFPLSTAAPESS